MKLQKEEMIFLIACEVIETLWSDWRFCYLCHILWSAQLWNLGTIVKFRLNLAGVVKQKFMKLFLLRLFLRVWVETAIKIESPCEVANIND